MPIIAPLAEVKAVFIEIDRKETAIMLFSQIQNFIFMMKLLTLLSCFLIAVQGITATGTPEGGTQKDIENDHPHQINDNPERYPYVEVEGDPLQARIYTLPNGLKVYLSRNDAEPRIMTNIAVRAGSKHDPADATGLAHYLEHMLFKGTSKIGALDWEREKVYLDKIAELYEQHRNTEDEATRRAIYREIDSLSFLASQLVGANEYDRMISSLGARGTNAYTSVEQTVYLNDIPSNELEKWLKIEAERFSEVVLRLFHTELEAVYEEFNISQDNDFRKVIFKINEVLFPSHQYGTQTTIGTGEHLKNPSHYRIYEYFNAYYHPNNMAVILAGDLDFDETIRLVDKYFGNYKPGEVQPFTFEPQPELTEPLKFDIYGQQAAYLEIAYRFDAEHYPMVEMIRGVLHNNKAGLIDLNLNQQQRVIEGGAWLWRMEDYNLFRLSAKPRSGQSLDEVRDLLLAEVEKLKAGEFDEWLLEAIVNDFRVRNIRSLESNNARASFMTNAFVLGIDWDDYVGIIDEMSRITKQEMVAFANRHFRNNHVSIYKKVGDDPNVYKVDKPEITPIELNREEMSLWTTAFFAMPPSEEIEAEFIDYTEVITTSHLPDGTRFDYMENTANELFRLYYIVDMGSRHNELLPLALNYLPYLGTSKYSPEDLQKELFRLGLTLNVNAGTDEIYVFLSGLDESFEEAVALFEHMLAEVQPNEEALLNVIEDELTQRANRKKDRRVIMNQAMISYARYGEVSPFTDIMSEEELRAVTSAELIDLIQRMTSYPHRVYYFGIRNPEDVKSAILEHKPMRSEFRPIPARKQYPELSMDEDKVLFVHFPMVQAEVTLISQTEDRFNYDQFLASELYNNYFGFGLSSIMFQEIRESKALAYSTFAFYSSPQRLDESHYLRSFVGTQADKLQEAIEAVRHIVDNMPVVPSQIEGARVSLQKRIESERLRGPSLYFSYYNNLRRGIDHDYRIDSYAFLNDFELESLTSFHRNHVRGQKFTFLVLGDRERIDMDYLKTIGEVTELSLEEIFGEDEIKP